MNVHVKNYKGEWVKLIEDTDFFIKEESDGGFGTYEVKTKNVFLLPRTEEKDKSYFQESKRLEDIKS